MTHRFTSSRKRLVALVIAAVGISLFADPSALVAQKSAVPAKADIEMIMHVLNRVGYGARPGDVERVRTMGLVAYIEEQLHPERIPDAAMNARLAEFTTIELDSRELAQKYYVPALELRRDQQSKEAKAAAAAAKSAQAVDPNMAGDAPPRPQVSPEQRQVQQAQANVTNELMQAKMLRAGLSDRQLEEVLTDFWFNHFNVDLRKGQVRQYLTEYEREAIRPFVLGKFRDLLGATAHSPAMLFYLDNWQSASANATPTMTPELQRRLSNPRIGVNPAQRQQLMQRLDQAKRQQAKGLNENYARELMELHTLGVDGGYTQQDVQELARILTGWTIDRPQQGGGFVFRPQMHDAGAKKLLGYTFAPGRGQDEGERALDILATHPSTARHIAFQLAQRFVADEPPTALVDRAATKFLDTKGDLREVTRLILMSPEFFSAEAYRAKVKTPLEFVISAVRATGATMVNTQPLVAAVRTLGMPLYNCQPPTGYSMTADAWVNTGALLNRMNFAVSLLGDGGRGIMQAAGPARPGGPPPPQQRPLGAPPGGRGRGGAQLARGPLQVDVEMLAPDVTQATRDKLVESFLAGKVSESTLSTLTRAQNPQQLIALTLGSPEFQRR
jgi:uncharacterized protein (DUF1800 family)